MPPDSVLADCARLREGVVGVVPSKTAHNLLIATWNVRHFGGLTDSWSAGPDDSPKRDWHAIALIAEILSHFDVVALQEVKREVTALRRLLDVLGNEWKVIVSDVTEGDWGNGERLAFLFNTSRVQASGLVGEIVLPSRTDQQFARTPYAASFERGGVDFILTTVHILWGSGTSARAKEITAFAEWMRDWSLRRRDWNENLLALGDFNLDRLGNPLYEALISTGLWPPPALNEVPRTIFHNDKNRNFYDQIAWFSDAKGQDLLTGLAYSGRAGNVDFLPYVYPGLSRNDISWRLSDHYPLWVEFQLA